MYFLLVLNAVLGQTPAEPEWNPVWAQNFSLTTYAYPYGINTVPGTLYYNSTLNTQRVDRANGRFDAFCGQNEWFMFLDTPCTHLVNSGIRYLYYPNLGVCCNCCSASDGCGILAPTWLNDSVYLGSFDYNGTTPAYLWNKIDRFYWETQDANPLNRQALELDDTINNKWVFTTPRYYSFTSSVFNVPTYCQSNYMCDPNSLCAQVRGSGGKSEHLKHLVF